MTRIISFGLVLSCLLLSAGCAAGDSDALDASEEAPIEQAASVPAEVTAALAHGGGLHLPAALLDQVHTVDHLVPVGAGRRIHVRESYTLRSWLRFPHRAMMMMSGGVATGASFNAEAFNVDEPGYDSRDMMARRGFFAFSVDPEGTGGSTYPPNGYDVTYDRDVDGMTKVAQYVRLTRGVPRVDLLGESDGGGVFSELCARDDIARSCTMSTMLWRTGTAFFDATFGSPEFKQFLLSQPNGYLETVGDSYDVLLAGSDPEVTAWFKATQPGRFAAGTLVENFDLPSYDPSNARVPGLVIRGEIDQNFPLSDTQELAAVYGSHGGVAGGAELVVIPGALQIPRLEPAPHNTQYWQAVVDFVDP